MAHARIEGFRLCKAMGWTWEELERTPTDIADDFLYILTHGKH